MDHRTIKRIIKNAPKNREFSIILAPTTLAYPVEQPVQNSVGNDSGALNVSHPRNSCSIFRIYGKNDLSVNDIVVKSEESDIACIKARFSLAIKVEEAILTPAVEDQTPTTTTPTATSAPVDNLKEANTGKKLTLGYLPLDSVVRVENSCPLPKKSDPHQASAAAAANDKVSDEINSQPPVEVFEPQELEMIVTFECGKLAFTFRQDNNTFYVSSIQGVVNLDSTIVREFISDRPVFFTSDLNHHYKYDDLVEVGSKAKTKAFILTANFYHTELEVFRTTTSRDFIKPPDENSKPFLDDTH